MISANVARSLEIVSRSDLASPEYILSQLRIRQAHFTGLVCVLSALFLVLGRPDWTSHRHVGLALAIAFSGALVWQHYLRSESAISALTTILYTSAAIFFAHALWHPELWIGKAGPYTLPSIALTLSVLLFISVSPFLTPSRKSSQIILGGLIWIASILATGFYVFAFDQSTAALTFAKSAAFLTIGLSLLCFDEIRWWSFVGMEPRDQTNIQRALSARMSGPLLIIAVLPVVALVIGLMI